MFRTMISALIVTSMCVSCTAETPMQKDVREAKTRQDRSKPNPEWLRKKIVPLTSQEETDLKAAEDAENEARNKELEASMKLEELKEVIVDAHGFDKYPAFLAYGSTLPAAAYGYNEKAQMCAGTLDLIGGDGHTYVEYTPGGMSCYLSAGTISIGKDSGVIIPNGSGGVVINDNPITHNPDVEDRR